ncbi:MAG TPA: Xaa-Pro aminopeptidase [Blastocatellia bacterium]|nr:Xaa-Pro aminopeptidase [Blastocatellia bacterium]
MFRDRRDRFMREIQDGVAVFCSAPVSSRNSDVEYEYRQDSDFYYLTGFEEPESVAVFLPNHPEHKFVLFVRQRDKEKETWTGRRAGVEGAVQKFGANKAFNLEDLDKELPELLKDADTLYYRFGRNEEFNNRITKLLQRFQLTRPRTGKGITKIIDPASILHEMRSIKSLDDLKILRRAVEISAAGHLAAIRECRPGMYEYELEALIEYTFKKNGSVSPGYPTIVGAGANGTILHYNTNTDQIKDGDLVLVDAGAEYNFFTGDVTRTFPANGKFTEAQRDIYQLVLDAQLNAIDMVKPGATVNTINNRTVETLTEGMVRLGLLKGEIKKLIEDGAYRKFYMHRTSHWLGMDVHDVGMYQVNGSERALEPGMVLTVEPGLYISGNDNEVDPKYWDIGVRIEDDVLVTDNGYEVLSATAPKAINEIESVMRPNLG